MFVINLSDQLYTPFIKLEGEGFVKHEDYPKIKCSFVAGQFPDGNIEIVLSSRMPFIVRTGTDAGMRAQRAKIRGTFSDGLQLTAEGVCATSYTFSRNGTENNATTRIKPNAMRLSSRANVLPHTIRFALTSFQFHDIGGYAIRDYRFELEHNGIKIRVVPSNYYQRYEEWQRLRKYIDFTAIAELDISSRSQIHEHITLINDLCRLLSIAQGTIINWIFFAVFSEDKSLVNAFHRTALVEVPSNFFIIPCNTIENFVNIAFPNYQTYCTELLDTAVMSSYLDAFVSNSNIRTRAISLVITLERLANLYKLYAIKGMFHEDLSTFGKKLKSMCVRFALDDTIIPTVIAHRNSLVHQAIFKDVPDTHSVNDASIEAYGILKGFISKLILAILGYRDNYYDWTDGAPKLKLVS